MTKKTTKKPENLADYGIGTCLYPPQEVKYSLPEYDDAAEPPAPVAALVQVVRASAAVGWDFSPEVGWQALQELLLRNQAANDRAGGRNVEILLDAIAEQGPRMKPLLRRLRQMAGSDARLAALADRLEERLKPSAGPIPALAPREKQVMERAAAGQSNAEIARALNIQVVTVAKALTRVYRKLGAKNRSEAVHKWLLIRDETE